jgi:hypothetical protein
VKELENIKKDDVIVFKGVSVSNYKSKSLNSNSMSLLYTDLNLDIIDRLKNWVN